MTSNIPKWWTAQPPHRRVLIAWRTMGRTGLTIHALAHVLHYRGEGRRFVKHVLSDPYVYPQYCSVVRAPVWAMSQHRRGNLTHYKAYVNMAYLLVDAYPFAKYIGVDAMAGIKTLQGITPAQLGTLRRAGSGKVYPVPIGSEEIWKSLSAFLANGNFQDQFDEDEDL